MAASLPPEFEPDRAALVLVDTQHQWNTPIFEGLRKMSLEGGMPANARSEMVSEVWLEALPHILNQFHYDATADPAQRELVGRRAPS